MAFATSPYPLAAALLRDIPGIDATTRIEPTEVLIREAGEYHRSENFCYSEPLVFTFTFLEGTPANALSAPASIVLTRSMEMRYFGKDPALGRTMICNDKPWRVTGVIADQPPNTDIPINALLSKDYRSATAWMDDLSVFTFALFRQKPDLQRFAAKLPAIARYSRRELDSSGATGYRLAFEAETLTDVHFSKGKLQDNPKVNRDFNTIFSGLAALILLLALTGPSALGFLAGLYPFTGLLAGAWPAFVLSRFDPVDTLKGTASYGKKTGRPGRGIGLRKILTVIQFVIALTMLAGTAVIYWRMQYTPQKDPGMDRSGARAVSTGSGMPIEGVMMATTIAYAGNKRRELMCNYFYIDPQFIPLLQMSLIAGRNLTDSLSTDQTEAFIVNEAFVKEMHFSQC